MSIRAGGGGNKSEHRKAKIQVKNEKLFQERQRNAKETSEDKKKHEKKTSKSHSVASGPNAVNSDTAADETDDKFAGVHPSRRKRMW